MRRAVAALQTCIELDIKPRDIMTMKVRASKMVSSSIDSGSDSSRLTFIMTMQAFENAVRLVMVTGGSTNATIHLIAMARALPPLAAPCLAGCFQPLTLRPLAAPYSRLNVPAAAAPLILT